METRRGDHCFICSNLRLYRILKWLLCRVGEMNIYGAYTVFLAEKSPNIRSYTVYTALANLLLCIH